MSLPADPVWLITGCSTGFGRELARLVTARGWRLLATARDAAQVADLAEAAPDRVKAVALDVTRPDQVRAAVQAALPQLGYAPLPASLQTKVKASIAKIS